MKLILDSGSDMIKHDGDTFEVVPLTISTEAKEYKDDADLNVMEMVNEMENTKGKSKTACPAVNEFINAIAGAKQAIIVSLAGKLSGSYNSANVAAGIYMEDNEDAKIMTLDSNAIGPGQKLLSEKFYECEKEGKSVEDTFGEMEDYTKNHLKMSFCLKSLKNLANNGRISPVIAKLVNAVGIRVVGIFSEWKEIQPTKKAHGDKKAVEAIVTDMKEAGYKGGKAIIDHCDGEEFAKAVANRIREEFASADLKIGEATGVVSFYAERGGIVVGYEV